MPLTDAPPKWADYPDKEVTTIQNPNIHDAEAQQLSPQTLALAVLGWVLEDSERAERYLDLTGLDADTLRGGLNDPTVLASVFDFLANHEPDLIRAAEALAVTPEELIAARQELAS